MNPPLIVNLITQMEAGGAQGAAVRMSEALRTRGYHAETWFLYQKRPVYAGEPHIRVMLDHPPRVWYEYLVVVGRLLRELAKARPDAVISYTHYANVIGQAIAQVLGIRRRVASQRNLAWSYPWVARMLDRIIGRLGTYTTNIVVSRSVEKSFEKYPANYRKRIKLVYNGIARRQSTLTPQVARVAFGLPASAPVIATVGRLADEKNQAILIRAVQLINGCHLAIAGGGELAVELRALVTRLEIADRVHFMGEIRPESIPDFLRAADLFAFPSKIEAFGFAVLEACAAGLPVLASDIDALREILGEDEDAAAALFVDPRDAGDWARMIEQVLLDSEMRERLARSATRRALRYDLANMVDGYEACANAERE